MLYYFIEFLSIQTQTLPILRDTKLCKKVGKVKSFYVNQHELFFYVKIFWQYHHNIMWYHFKCSFRISTTNFYVYPFFCCSSCQSMTPHTQQNAQKAPNVWKDVTKDFFQIKTTFSLCVCVCVCVFWLYLF